MTTSGTTQSWVRHNDGTGVPMCSVVVGFSREGQPIYAVKVNDGRGGYIAGNYEDGKPYAEYELYGAKHSRDWQYIVTTEDISGECLC